MDIKEDLDRVIALFEESLRDSDKDHKNMKRLRSELNDSASGFSLMLRKSLEKDMRLHESIKVWLLDGEGRHIHSPKRLSSHLKNHILRLEKISNYYSISVMLSGLVMAAGAANIKESSAVFLLGALGSAFVAVLKNNLDNKNNQYKVLANHLELIPDKM